MKSLLPHLRAVYSIAAVFVMLIFVKTAAYNASHSVGDVFFVLGAILLAVLAGIYGSRWEGRVLPTVVAMALSFSLLAAFASFNWLLHSMMYDLHSLFAEFDVKAPVIFILIVPLMVASGLVAPLFKHCCRRRIAQRIFGNLELG